MRTFALAAFVAAVSATNEVESAFLGYITEHGKSYASVEEYGFRLSQFARNHATIIEHNATESSFKLGHNKMSDWTEAEYKAILTHQPQPEHSKNYEYIPEVTYPTGAIDWRTKGKVSAVKDQGQCGSCWSFSANCALETAWAINKGTLYNLAEQELVDCDTSCYGCNGGWQYKAFEYYESHYATLTSNWKYTAHDGTCSYSSKSHTKVKTKGYKNVTADNSDQMKAALELGVLSVSIQADQQVFQQYSNGIFNSSACGTTLDHAVAVVGWGFVGDTEYWIMRNSWGTNWGISGYMEMEIVSGKGICGVQMEPLYPTV